MSLRRKLLLVALSVLALPWAGWQFVRQMEALLRQGQEQALIASGKALARSLAAIRAELPPLGPALYVHPITTPPQIDGYASDWASLLPYAHNLGPPNDAQKLKLLLGADEGWFYLLAEVRDGTRQRADARDPQAERADHLSLTLTRGGFARRYLIASAAPGPFEALASGIDGGPLPTTLIGEWQEDGTGYRIELRLPRSQMPDQLSLSAFDAETPAHGEAELRSLAAYSSSLAHSLGQFAPEQTAVKFLSADAWLIAATGDTNADDNAAARSDREGVVSRLVYRLLIAPSLTGSPKLGNAVPRYDLAEVWQALSGVPAASWRAGERSGDVVLSTVVPFSLDGEVRGALVLEQASGALPMLTNDALKRLAFITVLALLIAGGVLFAFASWLSLRIRRLRDAAERALASDGRMTGAIPSTGESDELGDLARSFQRLIEAVGAYTDYLRTLASKLSHELHTPLAIVKSSLDNLEQQGLAPNARPYLQRARDGADRLSAIVRAMSEASRMERAIASADAEDFDLAELVRGCTDSYRALAAPRNVTCLGADESLPFHGAAELIAQALDKLFDNARSFTPEDGWIRLTLTRLEHGAEIAVSNQGPLLPAAMQERLFESLVTVRDKERRGDVPHLGLGLSVVRMVAEKHAGSAVASNLPGSDGVEFVLRLIGMPRERMGG
jgi:two-component system sensor histidine kinase ChvG